MGTPSPPSQSNLGRASDSSMPSIYCSAYCPPSPTSVKEEGGGELCGQRPPRPREFTVIARPIEDRPAYIVVIASGRPSRTHCEVFPGSFSGALADALLDYDRKHPGPKCWNLGKVGRKFTNDIIARIGQHHPQTLENWTWAKNVGEPPGWMHGRAHQAAKAMGYKLRPPRRKAKPAAAPAAAPKNPKRTERGLKDDILHIRVSCLVAYSAPAAALDGEQWKEQAKIRLFDRTNGGKQFHPIPLSLGDLLAVREPKNAVALLAADGQDNWAEVAFLPRRIAIGDVDHIPFEEMQMLVQTIPHPPFMLIESARGGVHPVWVLDEPLNSLEEMRDAFFQLHEGLPCDKGAASGELRFFRPGSRRVLISNQLIAKASLNLSQPQKQRKPAVITAKKKKAANQGSKHAHAVLNRVLSEWQRHLRPIWGPKRYELCKCPSGLPLLTFISPLEKSPGGFRINSTGQIFHFGKKWGKQIIQPDIHGAKFDASLLVKISSLFRQCRNTTLDCLEEVAKMPVYPGLRLPVHRILELHGSRPGVIKAIGWRKMRTRKNGKQVTVCVDPAGRQFASIPEAAQTHRRLAVSPPSADSLVDARIYTEFLVSRVTRYVEFARRLERRVLDQLANRLRKAEKGEIGWKDAPPPLPSSYSVDYAHPIPHLNARTGVRIDGLPPHPAAQHGEPVT